MAELKKLKQHLVSLKILRFLGQHEVSKSTLLHSLKDYRELIQLLLNEYEKTIAHAGMLNLTLLQDYNNIEEFISAIITTNATKNASDEIPYDNHLTALSKMLEQDQENKVLLSANHHREIETQWKEVSVTEVNPSYYYVDGFGPSNQCDKSLNLKESKKWLTFRLNVYQLMIAACHGNAASYYESMERLQSVMTSLDLLSTSSKENIGSVFQINQLWCDFFSMTQILDAHFKLQDNPEADKNILIDKIQAWIRTISSVSTQLSKSLYRKSKDESVFQFSSYGVSCVSNFLFQTSQWSALLFSLLWKHAGVRKKKRNKGDSELSKSLRDLFTAIQTCYNELLIELQGNLKSLNEDTSFNVLMPSDGFVIEKIMKEMKEKMKNTLFLSYQSYLLQMIQLLEKK